MLGLHELQQTYQTYAQNLLNSITQSLPKLKSQTNYLNENQILNSIHISQNQNLFAINAFYCRIKTTNYPIYKRRGELLVYVMQMNCVMPRK